MSYKITLRVYQTNPNNFFRIVEKTVFNYANGGSWNESNGEQIVTFGGSGTSGTLRFLGDNGENFLVAVGIHNSKRWGDIVTSLAKDQTGVSVNPEYYNGKRDYQREKQLESYSVKSATGRNYQIKYTVAEGNDLKAILIIG
jgi:hypothetical protein